MKVLVTGGAGFIGSHLAKALSARGASVVILDDFSTGSEENLSWRTSGTGVEVVRGDVSDSALVEKLVPGCDWVFHEAAIASVPLSVEKPWLSHDVNLNATLKLLVAARDAGVRRFVFASSSAIYGDDPTPAKHENLGPRPLTPYGLQKYAGETYGVQFHRLYGLPFVALRYFNVFGPKQSFDSPYSGVIAKFCTKMLKGGRPTIFGDGLQSRDFVSVENVVAANLAVAEAPDQAVAGRFFNIGCGRRVTLLDLVRDINALTGQSLDPEFQAARAGDVRDSLADITAAREAFGYDPQVSWMDGLKRTLEFYQS